MGKIQSDPGPLRCRGLLTHLSVGVLDRDLPVSEREHVTALNFNETARIGAGEHPLADASIPRNEVFKAIPLGVGEGRKNLRYPSTDFPLADVDGPLHLRTTAGLEHAVWRHHREDRIDIMPVPGRRKGVEKGRSYLLIGGRAFVQPVPSGGLLTRSK